MGSRLGYSLNRRTTSNNTRTVTRIGNNVVSNDAIVIAR